MADTRSICPTFFHGLPLPRMLRESCALRRHRFESGSGCRNCRELYTPIVSRFDRFDIARAQSLILYWESSARTCFFFRLNALSIMAVSLQ